MEPFYRDPVLTVWQGDCRAVLAGLEPESVHVVMTSPPYWGLRDYGIAPSMWGGDPDHEHAWGQPILTSADAPGDKVRWNHAVNGDGRVDPDHVVDRRKPELGAFCSCGAWRGVLGLEPTPELYVAHVVEVFRAVRRVLRADGTLWLNLGDSYTSGGRQTRDPGQSKIHPALVDWTAGRAETPVGLKPKDLVGIPWRVAFALQADGWWLRRDVIWNKPNPMPESVFDRPTSSHEYLFLLSRSERYFYDYEGVRERALTVTGQPNAPASIASPYGQGFTRRAAAALARPSGWNAGPSSEDRVGRYQHEGEVRVGREAIANPNRVWSDPDALARMALGRNLRSVWTIPTEPYPGAHFATFPTRLVVPCIKAGTSERGVCPECLTPWVRTDDGWRPSCRHGGRSDDMEVLRTPVGEGEGGEYHRARLTAGRGGPVMRRRGLDRSRADDEGVRPMFRWQQRDYARQLRESPHRADMEAAVGSVAFAHYIRTDRSGARAIPPVLLERWLADGTLAEPVDVATPVADPVPAVVLDPFAGSGTVALVAERLGRRAVLIEASEEYIGQALERVAQGRRDGEGPALDMELPVPDDSLWAGVG